MKKIIAKELYKRDPEKFVEFRIWGKINECIIIFERKSTLKTFEHLFGNDGVRLWDCFCSRCNKDVFDFKRFLLSEQYNDLLVNACLNEELYLK